MANVTPSINTLPQQVEHSVRKAGPWVEKCARAGYFAKGVVYIVIGILALMAALTSGGKTTNSQGALGAIVQQPFGQFLVGLVGIGLAGYALWRFIQAGVDTENKGSDAKGWTARGGFLLSGIAYGTLAYTAFALLTGAARQSSGASSTQDGTARLMALPFGQALVGLVGIVIIGLGLAQMIKGYQASFRKHLDLHELSPALQKWAVISGRCGHIARGIVFMIIGGFFIEAARYDNPQKAKGLGSALDLLSQQTYGPLLLGIVAAGLVAYGGYMLVEARYRRIMI